MKDAAVYVERVDDSDERVFEDSLTAEEARKVAGLLTKFADKLDEERDSDKAKESDDAEESERSDGSEQSEESEDSEDSEKAANSSD